MIIDCFPFFNELDLLEIRLNELKDVVDVFVISEATLTHRGNPKPLYFDEVKDQFSEFNIEHVIVDDYNGLDCSNSWALEVYQRDCGVDHIKKMGPASTDVILLSDCDEIWRADKVERLANTTGWTRGCAIMPLFSYYMNCLVQAVAWTHPRWIKGDQLGINPIRCCSVDAEIVNAGWHFGYLGDIKEKLESFAHSEYDKPPYTTPEYIAERKANLESLFNSGNELKIINNLNFLPKYVLKNLSKFKQHIYIEGA